jgi:hypothetical protein
VAAGEGGGVIAGTVVGIFSVEYLIRLVGGDVGKEGML